MNITRKLAKPNEAEAKALSTMFPSSTPGPKKRPRSFDPTSECCVSSAQKKKKAAISQGRPTNIQVVLLQRFTPNLPRGKHRSLLKNKGRILTLQFRRSMSVLDVKNTLRQSFSNIEDFDTWSVLECMDNNLSISKKQDLDGEDVINRKGALYLMQTQKKVLLIHNSVQPVLRREKGINNLRAVTVSS